MTQTFDSDDFNTHFGAVDDIPSNPRVANKRSSLNHLIAARLSRRAILGGLGATALSACRPSQKTALPVEKTAVSNPPSSRFVFPEIARGTDVTHRVPEGYTADILMRWGDGLSSTAPEFDPNAQIATHQAQQFGYNNDFIGFVSLGENRGLLCVNHEYTNRRSMFPKAQRGVGDADRIATEMAAHGGTVMEITRTGSKWRVVTDSPYNRRITAMTPMTMSGPAAGHARLKTPDDPTGRTVFGMLGNCAGGITPWGTYLTAEENINFYFGGGLASDSPESENHERYGVPANRFYDWYKTQNRFDVGHAPNEPNRFGWIVEIDPKDPTSTPKKRTSLGRFKHEGAETILTPDGRVVVYMGDDQAGDYLYKFVSTAAYNPDAPNPDMLDDGTLYVARFDETGVDWLPLIWGQGPLTPQNGFDSQADVLIAARLAADALEATSMDRPEDVQPNPKTGRVYVMLTNNTKRTEALAAPLRTRLNVANPRPDNTHGHIIEIIEPDGDFAATRSEWAFLVKCGDPQDPNFGAVWNPATTENGWFTSPDNCAIDPLGRLWIATDGNEKSGASDGLWALETEGDQRGTGRAFFRAPVGAEVCGPCFTPDGETLFLAIQHPGDGEGTSFENPATRWPDFDPDMPPRSSVIAIYKTDGGVIGT